MIPARVSLTMLLIMTLLGAGYLGIEVLHVNPLRDDYTVRVLVKSSGGLMDTSQVDMRGVRIGRVRAIDTTIDGLAVTLEIDGRYRVPIDAPIEIANLSAAGEQYLDFRPTHSDGPYLRDGSVVSSNQVTVAATVSEVLERAGAVADQIDPAKLQSLADTLTVGLNGRDEDVRQLLRTLARMGNMLRDKREQIARLYRNVQILGDDFDGYGPLLGQAAPQLADIGPTLVGLIQAFQHYAEVGYDAWDNPIGPFIAKIGDYISDIGPAAAMIAVALKPATTQIRPIRVNVGSIVDVLSAAFPGDGAAHLEIQPPR